MVERTHLTKVLAGAVAGTYPHPGGRLTVTPQPSERDAGVLAFTGHAVVFIDLDPDEVASLAGCDRDADGFALRDLSAPLNPPFLTALAARTGRRVNNIDQLTLATPLPGPPPFALEPVRDAYAHPRLARARRYRDDVRAWRARGGLLILGRGVAGRWEAAVEVDVDTRGRGLGRALAAAARHLVPGGAPLWAQVAPGNAASVRAFASAGYVPVGAEALLVADRGAGTRGPT